MRRFRCRWLHDRADEPVDFWIEVGDDGYEVRKVEIYRDGRMGYADAEHEVGAMRSEGNIPTVDEMARDPQFAPGHVTIDQFEDVWRRAVASPSR